MYAQTPTRIIRRSEKVKDSYTYLGCIDALLQKRGIMAEQIFVGRDAEIETLRDILDKVNRDHACQASIIVGNAGAGKTTLIEQFAQFAEEQYSEKVIVAIGKCNAQTGTNDTYLPFREILNQLTGIQTRLLRSSMSNRPTSWLRSFADGAMETLIKLGPDLIGTFVPGTALLARLASTTIDTSLKKRAESRAGNQEVKREEVREQYSAILRNIAKDTTIILIVDDLHWADEASMDLFVHLTKSLKKYPIMIIGTYRPEDIGKDHILVDIVNNFQAQFGEIVLDLRKSSEQRGEEFTNLFLIASRAEVSEPFRTEFFNRTKGNALFTVELFRYLYENKLLMQNEAGFWVESREMDWNKLPAQLARLEGLIAARFDALSPDLRQILDIASIEGQDFTAQVIMHFLKSTEFEILRILSAELDKKHNLVSEVREIPVGSTVLSNYRFVNGTFHQYIYNDMSLGQRRLRHKEVAETLEELYGANSREIAFQLARHFELSYEPKKVVQYLNLAGEQLANVSEFKEAEAVFNRALSLAKIINYKHGEVDSIRHVCGSIWIPKDNDLEAEKQLLEVLDMSRSIHYTDGEIYILRQLGILARKRRHYTTATRYYLESLNLAKTVEAEAETETEKCEAKKAIGQALNNLGTVAMADNAYEDAEEYLKARLKVAMELNSQEGKLFAFVNLGDLYWRKGLREGKKQQKDAAKRHWAVSKGYLEQALEIGNSSGAKSQIASTEKSFGDVAISEEFYAEASNHICQSLNIVVNVGITSKILGNLVSAATLLHKKGEIQHSALFARFVSAHPRSSEFEKELADNVINEIRANNPAINIDEINQQLEGEDRETLAKKALEVLQCQDI